MDPSTQPPESDANSAGGLSHFDYAPIFGVPDEMIAPDGAVRPHWEPVMRLISRTDPTELRGRHAEIRRILRESGVTYNIAVDSHPREKAWELDVIPGVCAGEEWLRIEPALAQRLRLFRAILDDLYGPRRLLADGVLPPELIFASGGYLLPCVSESRRAGGSLLIHGVDLARGPGGEYIVLGDRTQSPSGLGYALKNRLTLTRVLQELFRDSLVLSLNPFVRQLDHALMRVTPHDAENPRGVLLTSGPGSETYYEHAFLARMLGLTLVEGRDLTVRSGRVLLKTLHELQAVDVILRRQDDDFCDPLELRPDSLLGVPGLAQAERLGNVTIANPLGSGILENPGLGPFLPAVARHLLDEELGLGTVPTWWCGHEVERDHVLENMTRLVIKPIHRGAGSGARYGELMSAAERDELRRRILADPHQWVGQEVLDPCTIPSSDGLSLTPRRWGLRVFGFTADDAPVLMPGGLLRTSTDADERIVSSKLGGGSKDFWVVSPVSPVIVPAPPLQVRAPSVPAEEEVPSRVGESLFWMGRYAERTEATARLIRESLLQLLALERTRRPELTEESLRLIEAQTWTAPPGSGQGRGAAGPGPSERFDRIVTGAGNPGSIRYNLERLHDAARSLPDRLPDETWRILQNSRACVNPADDPFHHIETMDELIVNLAALESLSRESLPCGPSADFFEIGRRMERADQTTWLLRRVLFDPATAGFSRLEEAQALVLAAADSLGAWRRIYRDSSGWRGVVDLLVFRETHPRSVACQVGKLLAMITALPRGESPASTLAEDALRRAQAAIRSAGTAAAAARDAEPPADPRRDPGLGSCGVLLPELTTRLFTLSDSIERTWFSHVGASLEPTRIETA